MPAKKPSNEIHLTRIFDAAVHRVWDAWTDPKQWAQWWGPRGFSITTHHKEVKVGGTWVYTMHGPDGVDYPNSITCLEVKKHARLVYDHGASADSPPLFRVTVVFSEQQGSTKMQMTMALPSAAAAVQTKQFIKGAGGDTTWDRLAEYLAPTDCFFFNRTFDASVETLFDAWTDPVHLMRWLPPAGFTMRFIEAKIRPGGASFYCMQGPNDMKMYGKAHYREISRPDRIVYTQSFCDEHGKIARHPMSATWPETMLTTVTLNPESPDTTRVTIKWEVFGDANAAERETFRNAKGGMTQGWTGSLEKLAAFLQ